MEKRGNRHLAVLAAELVAALEISDIAAVIVIHRKDNLHQVQQGLQKFFRRL